MFLLFEIVASSDDQEEDAGWYFWYRNEPEPCGPFETSTLALEHARVAA